MRKRGVEWARNKNARIYYAAFSRQTLVLQVTYLLGTLTHLLLCYANYAI